MPQNEKKHEAKIDNNISPTLNHNTSEPNPWQTYRTRFTVHARILSAPLSFIDGLGREQSGKPGDYLVESNGVVTITQRRIFEDIYVVMSESNDSNAAESRQPKADGSPRKSPISTKKNSFFPASRRRSV